MIADDVTKRKMEDTIVKNKKDVSEVIQHVHLNIFENESGRDKAVEFEDKINNILNKTINDAGKIGLKSLDKIIEWLIWLNQVLRVQTLIFLR